MNIIHRCFFDASLCAEEESRRRAWGDESHWIICYVWGVPRDLMIGSLLVGRDRDCRTRLQIYAPSITSSRLCQFPKECHVLNALTPCAVSQSVMLRQSEDIHRVKGLTSISN